MQPQKEINVNFGSRLAGLIAGSSYNQKEISIQTGISESGLANYKKDRTPKSEELYKLASFFEVTMEWLLTGEKSGVSCSEGIASSIVSPQSEIFNEEALEYNELPRMVPVLGMAHAGIAVDYEEVCRVSAEEVPTLCKDPQSFALDVEGDSMIPLVNHRDRVVVMPMTKAHNGCVVVARLKDEGVICRKIENIGGRIRLVPSNPLYPHTEHEEEDFEWIYPVFGSWTQLWNNN